MTSAPHDAVAHTSTPSSSVSTVHGVVVFCSVFGPSATPTATRSADEMTPRTLRHEPVLLLPIQRLYSSGTEASPYWECSSIWVRTPEAHPDVVPGSTWRSRPPSCQVPAPLTCALP